MYKVKNISGGSLPLGLEKGYTTLSKNEVIDLDTLCSRDWIEDNEELQKLLDPNSNALAILHDNKTNIRRKLKSLSTRVKNVIQNPPWLDVKSFNKPLDKIIPEIGSSKVTLLVSKPLDVNNNITIPSNVTLKFLREGYLKINGQAKITINGPFEAGLHKVFTYDSITFGPGIIDEVYPEWWGAVADYNPETKTGTDNKWAIDAALKTCSKVKFNRGYYRYHGAMKLDNSYSYGGLYGSTREHTRIYFTNIGTYSAIYSTGTTFAEVCINNFTFKDIGLYGPGKAVGTIKCISFANSEVINKMHHPRSVNFESVHIEGFSDIAVWIPGLWSSTIKQLQIWHCGSHGLVIGGAPTVLIEDCNYFDDIDGIAIWVFNGRPILNSNNIGACTSGLRFGRRDTDFPYPFNTNAYCTPSINGVNVEPFTDTGLYFNIQSYPLAMNAVRLHAAENTTVNYGIYFDYVQGDIISVIGKVSFAVKTGGSYTEKIYIENGTGSGAGVIYLGPVTDLSTNGDTQKLSTALTIEKGNKARFGINSYITLLDGENVGKIEWTGTSGTITIWNSSINENSIIVIFPTNQDAAQLCGSTKHPYIYETGNAYFILHLADEGDKPNTDLATFNYITFN